MVCLVHHEASQVWVGTLLLACFLISAALQVVSAALTFSISTVQNGATPTGILTIIKAALDCTVLLISVCIMGEPNVTVGREDYNRIA